MKSSDKVLLPILIKRSGRLIDKAIDQLLKQHMIARSQYRLLYYVANLGEPTQKELIERLQIQGPTLTLMVDALTQKGWLVRVNDPRDRRTKRLRLTPSGQKLFAKIPDPSSRLHQVFVKEFGKQEVQMLEASLQKIIDILSKKEET